MHTFIETKQDDGRKLYSVGSWCPPAYQDARATWNPLRDCASAAEAAHWVSFLNGGERPQGGSF